MKRIQYTSEQEKKLIEMSLFLFPEYKEIHINGAWIYFNKELRPFDSIPIFEFCMTHLCDKISMNLTNQMCTGMPQYYDESEKLDWNSQSLVSMLKECHPIDYLYEEFKKLK